MKHRTLILAVMILFVAGNGNAQNVDSLPPYQPQEKVTGTIRSWGHVFLLKVMKDWEEGFRKFQPEVQFEDNLVSSAIAVGSLYTRVADLGIVGREIRLMDVAGYQRVMKHKPLGIEVMTGSYANADKSVALAVFVHKDNPLSKLSFKQLDAIFGSEHLLGEKQNIRTWGQLGLTGEWKDKSIQVYTGVLDAAPGFYFSQVVLKGSLLWNGDLHYFDDQTAPDGKTIWAQQTIVEALAKDRYGIALSGAGFKNPNVKAIALSAGDGGQYIEPTLGNIVNRSYPLARSVWIYITRDPGKPVDPKVREFLRYILSREGQQAVVREGEYLPLTAEMARAQLKKLE